jgi:hypothetical protein
LALQLLMPVPAGADARSDYLIRLLKGSTQFRVRAQAAISLGGVGVAPDVFDALVAAVSDDHPAVRAAAANSLARMADPRALRALRLLVDDPEPPVRAAAKAAIAKLEASRAPDGIERDPAPVQPSGPVRYYIAVGKPASRVPNFTAADLDRVQQLMRDRLAGLDGVELAAMPETPAKVRALLRTRNLRGFYIDSAVTSVENKPGGGTRVAVSVIVATYPDRAMRAIMQGAATALGGGDTRSAAIAGALKSALSQLPQALARD